MVGIGAFFLLKKNSSQTKVETRSYCVVKFEGIPYSFPLTFEKNIKISDMLKEIGILEVEKIYEVSGRSSHEISVNSKLTTDSTFKVRLK